MGSPSEPDRTEQIITHFFHKTLHAVLASRIPQLRPAPRPASAAKRDRWFHLDLGDLPAPIAHHGGVLEPLVVDIILTPRRDAAESGAREAVVERWTAHCVPGQPCIATQHHHDGSLPRRTYRKSIILLRSLYAMLRILPANRIFRLLCSSGQPYNYDLSYRVSSVAALSSTEQADLKLYSFTPVETIFGQLVVSVQYRPNLAGFNLEVSSPMPPMVIMDYIGSPAADPVRPFPSSLPEWASRPTTSQYQLRGIRTTAEDLQFDRPHSWNTAPMAHHPLSSAHNRVAELGSSPPEHYARPVPNQRLLSERKGSSISDDFKPSPPISTSTSPSPPTHGHSLQSRLRAETAPMSIPMPGLGRSQIHRSPNLSDPFKNLLPPPSPRNTRADPSYQESPSKSKSFRKSEGLNLENIYSNLHIYAPYKGLTKDGREDSGRFSALSSGGSPRHGFSRSSSRLSMPDDLDDGDFSYPFAVDDVDTSDSQTRSPDVKEAEYSSSHKSQEAAVGVLVHMLRTAPPLRQDQSCSSQSSDLQGEVSMSSSVLSRKTSDALEELRSYREMKNFLLSKSGAETKLQESVKQNKGSKD